MSVITRLSPLATAIALSSALTLPAQATESLFGFVKGAETLPEGAIELYQAIKRRSDKGQGDYTAYNLATELEYGVSNRFSTGVALKMQSLETSGLIIDGYLPKAVDNGLKFSGVEASMKYMFLSPAKDDIGLSGYMSFNYDWIDPHSGQDKDTYSLESELLLQKYFLEGELIWAANGGVEATYADRAEIDDLPEDFEWPTDPEMEIELKFGTGLSYRFAPKWFIGIETFYETEFETEVGQERWSVFAGPTLHYGTADWWATLTWFNQLSGGGEQYENQMDDDLHLIEKTKNEVKLVVAYNF
ncbi:hypothetical protein P2G88_02685 [Aliiglaciecola sp. CAU 1673]|uniref:DUF6662 family protein n=1 Tax=Aliiglaciecola sp. CAU 1673 TaxID=3032595 RepID=UPI0023DCD38E|nr:DUF6662 family protein [Aliiglaciecola sp. CAU 1673]MDF2177150.1 hypothetical protein [Aliiglaciecola sp. CAU 1673]